jgi:hypothetical protein
MTRCDDVRLELQPYLMGELLPRDAQSVAAHVDSCAACREEMARVAAVHRLLVEAPLDRVPSSRLEDEVFSLVALDRVGRLASEVPLGAEPPDELERAALERAGILAPRRSRTVTVLVPALGVATVVLGILGMNWRSEADRMRDDLGPLGQTLQLVDLEGSPEPPDETTVELVRYGDRAYKVVVDGAMPPAPEGHYYEVWMIGAAGRVSCGTFNAGYEDTVHTFPVGVDPSEYPIIEITLEPADGDESMNGTPKWEGRLDAVGAAP